MDKNQNNYKNKKILVFGLGLNQGGAGAAKFFARAGAEVKVTDLKTAEELKPSLEELKEFPQISFSLGQHNYEDIDWAELIIKNPAVKPVNAFIDYAKSKGKQVEQDVGIFLQLVGKDKTIGVTGTKGKSTTTSLIYQALISNGQKAVLAGNIGTSVLEVVDQIEEDSLVVLELSSFQLEAFHQHQTSPHLAVITNIYPDHLDYYHTLESYIEAKRAIAKYQSKSDYLFIRKNDPTTDNLGFLAGLQGQIIHFSANSLPKNFYPKLSGQHNLENLAAAWEIAKTLGLDEQKAAHALANFTGISYRMELVKEWNGIKIYNDSTATTPEASIEALKTFPRCILICGGMNKDLSYKEYAKAVDQFAKKVFFLEGSATEEIQKELPAISHQSSDKVSSAYQDLNQLLQDVKAQTKPGDIILFSPAATSFNLFKNEFDRGAKFNQAVEQIFTN